MGEIIGILGEGAGWIVGLGITLGIASAFTDNGKPMVKKAIKGYLSLTDRARVATAEMSENFQDLYAEARMEYNTDRASSGDSVSNGSNNASPIIIPGN
ncbi:MAG: DUF5132 domain-containing protein [Armatimonadota bacterium]|nr:DUF5132 domain-containing protein [Armatimonadota bacterium]